MKKFSVTMYISPSSLIFLLRTCNIAKYNSLIKEAVHRTLSLLHSDCEFFDTWESLIFMDIAGFAPHF